MSDLRTGRKAGLPLLIMVLLLVLGAVVAWGVGGALGLSFTPVAAAAERSQAAPERQVAAPPRVAAVAVPQDPRIRLAASTVADALVQRGAARPELVDETQTGADVLRVSVRSGLGKAESYRVSDAGGLSVEGADAAGAAAGLYAMADRIRSGAEVLAEKGQVVTPKLGLRLTDAGSVGRVADAAAFEKGTDYSLNTDVVGTALLPQAPWVNRTAVDEIAAQLRQFTRHSLAQGYNGIVLPGFLEYITFAQVGDGHAIYPAGDPHVARAQAMVAAFGPVFREAHDMGLKVYLLTDMLAVSPQLEAYLERVAGMDTGKEELWSVYQAGLAELFESMPFVDGLMVRIGEGGEVYAQAGWDYSSKIAVTTPESVRAMLRALLNTAGESGKDVIFRTWTVGLGAVGNLHTSAESYAEVLDGIDDPHLIVSTKYTLGDFYSHLPLNGTLKAGKQRRIVEFQARREFEAFGSLPNDLGGVESQALRDLIAANPRVEGVWNWTQDGGPLRAGPMTLYLRTGFWQLYDLNSYLAARLAWQPEADPAELTADWIRQTFSYDPATVAKIGEAMALSREVITKGLYLGPYADNSVKALGLEPPPMMWIFEWDVVTGDSAALDSIYQVSRDRLEDAVAEGGQAVELARRMRDTVASTPADTWRDPELRRQLMSTLDYQLDLLTTLGTYRETFLRHVQWLDTGSDRAYAAWKQAEAEYRAAGKSHVDRYGGDLALPAYNFTAADLGLERADRDLAMAWVARGLLALLGLALLLGSALGQRWLRGAPGAQALRGLWLGATRPWRVASLPSPTGRLDRLLVLMIPAFAVVLSRAAYTWFAAPAHLVLVLGAWLLFVGALRLLVRGQDRWHLWAVVGGVAVLRTVILLLALATRGPGRYWYNFWTSPSLRTLYVTAAFAAFCWLFAATAFVLRDRYGLLRRASAGTTLIAIGAPLTLLSGLIAGLGLERALTVWNDQMALLPWGLSRILGITVYLGIPTELPLVTLVLGLVLVISGLALRWRSTRPATTPAVG